MLSLLFVGLVELEVIVGVEYLLVEQFDEIKLVLEELMILIDNYIVVEMMILKHMMAIHLN